MLEMKPAGLEESEDKKSKVKGWMAGVGKGLGVGSRSRPITF
jgi:hypothetical protein